ncbi:hypothetical protein NicSoilC5_18190 [Arthrobacter sp. NicSoilC5]|nr:hypothetical protein NicSoilC5_18190 [Arthrobacter sp. NicSoilC5]
MDLHRDAPAIEGCQVLHQGGDGVNGDGGQALLGFWRQQHQLPVGADLRGNLLQVGTVVVPVREINERDRDSGLVAQVSRRHTAPGAWRTYPGLPRTARPGAAPGPLERSATRQAGTPDVARSVPVPAPWLWSAVGVRARCARPLEMLATPIPPRPAPPLPQDLTRSAISSCRDTDLSVE